jgi:hypothetical protein
MCRAEILPFVVPKAEEGRGERDISYTVLLAGQAGITLITAVMRGSGWLLFIAYEASDGNLLTDQQPNTKFSVKAPWGVTKRCRLSWLTNSALVFELQCGCGVSAWSQPMSTAVHRSPKKLRRSTVTPYSTYGRRSPTESYDMNERTDKRLTLQYYVHVVYHVVHTIYFHLHTPHEDYPKADLRVHIRAGYPLVFLLVFRSFKSLSLTFANPR